MIRAATAADIEALLPLLRAMHEETRYRSLPFSEQKVREMMAALIEGAGTVLAWQGEGGEVRGILAGVLMPQWFTEAAVAQDVLLYVAPQWRGKIGAVRLVNAFVAWARANGAAMIDLGVNTGIETERTGLFFERLGGRLCGKVYSWEAA